MQLAELLALVAGSLDATGTPYMVVGSFASIFHGEPRATTDIDVVVDPDLDALEPLRVAFQDAGLYVTDLAVALANRDMANVIDAASGWKVDLIIRKDRAFSLVELERRLRVDVLGIEVAIATAEDTVLSKLEWSKVGGSARQLEDAASVLEITGEDIDGAYLDRWAAILDIAEVLEAARRLAAQR